MYIIKSFRHITNPIYMFVSRLINVETMLLFIVQIYEPNWDCDYILKAPTGRVVTIHLTYIDIYQMVRNLFITA